MRAHGVRNTVTHIAERAEEDKQYSSWLMEHKVSDSRAEEERLVQAGFPIRPRFSIIVPTFNTPEKYLREMIESVTGQTYTNWELCIADGSPEHSAIQSVVIEYQKRLESLGLKDAPEIHFLPLEKNLGISGNTNAALTMASGDYVALLDHDDLMEIDALYEIVLAQNKYPKAEAFYTDEDMLDDDSGNFLNPNFKPDFNIDFLQSCNYITHFYAVKRTIALEAGLFSDECNGSQDYDFILKTTELAEQVVHIPRILYHWRIHMNSVAGNPEGKMYAYDSAVRALNNHYRRCGMKASVLKTKQFGYYCSFFELSGTPTVSIVLKGCSPKLDEQIQKSIHYPGIEIVRRASDASGDYLLFMNGISSIEVSDPLEEGYDFVSLLLSNCQREEIGLAGVKVLDSSGRVKECGLIYNHAGQVFSPFTGIEKDDPSYRELATTQHLASLIGPDCFMVSRDLLARYGSGKSSVYDLCMNLTDAGYGITVIPQAMAQKAVQEEQTVLRYTFPELPAPVKKHLVDPFYTPNFSQTRPLHLH